MLSFLKYTIGLVRVKNGHVGLVKIEISRSDNGSYVLQPVSGNNLSATMGRAVVIEADTFYNRPWHDDVDEAQWAMDLCGWNAITND